MLDRRITIPPVASRRRKYPDAGKGLVPSILPLAEASSLHRRTRTDNIMQFVDVVIKCADALFFFTRAIPVQLARYQAFRRRDEIQIQYKPSCCYYAT